MNHSEFIHISEIIDALNKHKIVLKSILYDLDFSEKYYDALRNEMDRMIARREYTIED